MAGVSERTIIRWMALPHFQVELRRVGIEISGNELDRTMRKLTAGQAAALDVLETIMRDGKEEQQRLAAINWLAIFRDFKELIDFEERVDHLEKELKP